MASSWRNGYYHDIGISKVTMPKTSFSLMILLALACCTSEHYAYSQEVEQGSEPRSIPNVNIEFDGGEGSIRDSNLKVEIIVGGLEFPTTMAFLGHNDMLVLEKEKGTVQRIINGTALAEPLLDVNVATEQERCMCGIAVSKYIPGHTYVFLYYTESEFADADDFSEGKNPLGNRLYRYELVHDKLVNPKLILDLPAVPGPRHNGGAITIGPDNNLYIPIGDVDGSFNPKGQFVRTMTQKLSEFNYY